MLSGGLHDDGVKVFAVVRLEGQVLGNAAPQRDLRADGFPGLLQRGVALRRAGDALDAVHAGVDQRLEQVVDGAACVNEQVLVRLLECVDGRPVAVGVVLLEDRGGHELGVQVVVREHNVTGHLGYFGDEALELPLQDGQHPRHLRRLLHQDHNPLRHTDEFKQKVGVGPARDLQGDQAVVPNSLAERPDHRRVRRVGPRVCDFQRGGKVRGGLDGILGLPPRSVRALDPAGGECAGSTRVLDGATGVILGRTDLDPGMLQTIGLGDAPDRETQVAGYGG